MSSAVQYEGRGIVQGQKKKVKAPRVYYRPKKEKKKKKGDFFGIGYDLPPAGPGRRPVPPLPTEIPLPVPRGGGVPRPGLPLPQGPPRRPPRAPGAGGERTPIGGQADDYFVPERFGPVGPRPGVIRPQPGRAVTGPERHGPPRDPEAVAIRTGTGAFTPTREPAQEPFNFGILDRLADYFRGADPIPEQPAPAPEQPAPAPAPRAPTPEVEDPRLELIRQGQAILNDQTLGPMDYVFDPNYLFTDPITFQEEYLAPETFPYPMAPETFPNDDPEVSNILEDAIRVANLPSNPPSPTFGDWVQSVPAEPSDGRTSAAPSETSLEQNADISNILTTDTPGEPYTGLESQLEPQGPIVGTRAPEHGSPTVDIFAPTYIPTNEISIGRTRAEDLPTVAERDPSPTRLEQQVTETTGAPIVEPPSKPTRKSTRESKKPVRFGFDGFGAEYEQKLKEDYEKREAESAAIHGNDRIHKAAEDDPNDLRNVSTNESTNNRRESSRSTKGKRPDLYGDFATEKEITDILKGQRKFAVKGSEKQPIDVTSDAEFENTGEEEKGSELDSLASDVDGNHEIISVADSTDVEEHKIPDKFKVPRTESPDPELSEVEKVEKERKEQIFNKLAEFAHMTNDFQDFPLTERQQELRSQIIDKWPHDATADELEDLSVEFLLPQIVGNMAHETGRSREEITGMINYFRNRDQLSYDDALRKTDRMIEYMGQGNLANNLENLELAEDLNNYILYQQELEVLKGDTMRISASPTDSFREGSPAPATTPLRTNGISLTPKNTPRLNTPSPTPELVNVDPQDVEAFLQEQYLEQESKEEYDERLREIMDLEEALERSRRQNM